MKPSESVAGRALLALLLMAGFYFFAVGIAAGLLFIPYAEWVYIHRVTPKLALVCLVGGVTILWSVLPRLDRFAAPGPLLTPEAHPRLYAEIQSVAHATGQKLPAEVFLVGDANAWVAQRGGVMGFFSRRVMGLGLPLMQALSVSEFRAVLAHEFGHYYGGDTRLGPWVYKTRAAIGRTLQGLAGSALQAPFVWYGNMFLRVSHAVSRRQEFSADALAARVIGARPLASGLKKIQATAVAYNAYWSEEVVPVLRAGYVVPIAEGFHQFTSVSRISTAMSQIVEKELREGGTDVYDTHPALSERLAAIADLVEAPDSGDDARATSLLSNLTEMERQWLGFVVDPDRAAGLKPIAWDSVVSTAILPTWRSNVEENAIVLGDATVSALGVVVEESAARGQRRPQLGGPSGDTNAMAAAARTLAAMALTLALERNGWNITAPPGAPVIATRGASELRPFEIVDQLAKRSLTGGAWREQAASLGIADLLLVEGM